MQAHAVDLRAEIEKERDGADGEMFVAETVRDWRSAPLSGRQLALCAYAEALTIDPGAMEEGHLKPLREQGVDDEGIHQAIQVVSYFNYINRVADGMHIDLEPEMQPYRTE